MHLHRHRIHRFIAKTVGGQLDPVPFRFVGIADGTGRRGLGAQFSLFEIGTKNFFSVQVDRRTVITFQCHDHLFEFQLRLFAYLESRAEVGGKVFVRRVLSIGDLGPQIRFPVAKRRLSGFPLAIIKLGVGPIGNGSRSVIEIPPFSLFSFRQENFLC